MRREQKSRCPINLSLEVFGDRWTLLVLRDMIFGGRRHFRELLNSEERISSDILSGRLKMLLDHGLVTRSADPTHQQRVTYSLTERAIALVPILIQIGSWGRRYRPEVSPELGIRIEVLERGGQPMWATFMDELRQLHLGSRPGERPPTTTLPVHAALDAAYQREVTRSRVDT